MCLRKICLSLRELWHTSPLLYLNTHIFLIPRNPKSWSENLLKMRKRAISGGVHGRIFKNLVLELWVKGLLVVEIVDDFRSKHRECGRKKRQSLMTRVKDIIEESNESRKKQRRDHRNSDFNTSSPSSASSCGNVEDNMQFDITSESLRATYSNKSNQLMEITKKKAVSSEKGGKGYDVEVKRPTFKDLGGLKGVLDELMFQVKLPLLCFCF